MLAASAAGRCSAGWLWVQPTAWCPLPTAHRPPFWVIWKVPCPRTPGHTLPPAPSYFESMETHAIRMSADSYLGGGVVRLDCGRGHPIFKKCSPCDPAQPQNRHTDSRPLSSSTPMPSLKKLQRLPLAALLGWYTCSITAGEGSWAPHALLPRLTTAKAAKPFLDSCL
jgi:hypothetical protein